jgi:hypothetical protein
VNVPETGDLVGNAVMIDVVVDELTNSIVEVATKKVLGTIITPATRKVLKSLSGEFI